MTRSLDLGCGLHPKNPFNADELFGIDIREVLSENIKKADLAIEPIPYDTEYFEYVTAYDFIEHIPRVLYVPERRNSFVELMNEIYRVMKVGGNVSLNYTCISALRRIPRSNPRQCNHRKHVPSLF